MVCWYIYTTNLLVNPWRTLSMRYFSIWASLIFSYVEAYLVVWLLIYLSSLEALTLPFVIVETILLVYLAIVSHSLHWDLVFLGDHICIFGYWDPHHILGHWPLFIGPSIPYSIIENHLGIETHPCVNSRNRSVMNYKSLAWRQLTPCLSKTPSSLFKVCLFLVIIVLINKLSSWKST